MMKRSKTISRSLAPAALIFTAMLLSAPASVHGKAASGGRKHPAAHERKRDDSQNVPDRSQGAVSEKKKGPAERRDSKDPPSGTTFVRRPPREAGKAPGTDKKEMGELGRNRRDDLRRHIMPLIRPRPPRILPKPRPPRIHYPRTIIYYDYPHVYLPEPLPGSIDEDLYGIELPFGPILPWEIGEFLLIRLKNLEQEGLGGTMIVAIVQTMDEMGWEEFLDRFGDNITDAFYYGPVGRTSFLVSMPVSDILDLMVREGIRWIGEYYPEYKIVPGGRNTKFYVLSLEGDTTGFRRELRDAGVFVMDFDPETQEYYVRSSQDVYSRVASFWWVARVSGVPGEPFFQPGSEWSEIGLAR
jgi:hypothetical protein